MNKLYRSKNTKNRDTSIRVVMSEDGKTVGLIGTVKDLLDEEVLTYCDAQPHMAALVKPDGTAKFYHDIDDLKHMVREMEC